MACKEPFNFSQIFTVYWWTIQKWKIKRKLTNALVSLTYPVWHKAVFHCINYAYSEGILDEKQLYQVLALFDRTQTKFYRAEKCLP